MPKKQRGPGRPRLETQHVRTNLIVDADLMEAIKQIAGLEDRSLASMLRRVLQVGVAVYRESPHKFGQYSTASDKGLTKTSR